MNVLKKTIIITYNIFHTSNVQLSRSVAYKSALSLDNLYQNSSLKLTSPSHPPNSSNEKFSGYIPIDKLDISYSRSTGPGGQNVNKVNTKVDLRFHLASAEWLDNDVKKKLAEKFRNKVTKEGLLIFRSDLTRSQQLNLADCLEKLRSTIRDACHEQPEMSVETAEKIRRKKEQAARERLITKREWSQTKQDRQSPNVTDIM